MANKNKTTTTMTPESILEVVKSGDINAISKMLQGQKDEFKKLEDGSWRTNGDLSMYGFNTNLKEEKLIGNVVRMFSSVYNRSVAYDSGFGYLTKKGLNTECPVWGSSGTVGEASGTVDDWAQDCIKRIQIIEKKENIDMINALIDESAQFKTVEDKKKEFFEKVANWASKKGVDTTKAITNGNTREDSED